MKITNRWVWLLNYSLSLSLTKIPGAYTFMKQHLFNYPASSKTVKEDDYKQHSRGEDNKLLLKGLVQESNNSPMS